MPPRLPASWGLSASGALPASWAPRLAPLLPRPSAARAPSSSTSSSRLRDINSPRPGARLPRGVQPGDAAERLVRSLRRRGDASLRSLQAQLESAQNKKMSDDFLRQMPRRFQVGDVYSPHDMSSVEMQKWRRRSKRNSDVVDALGIRPLDMYKNFSLVQDFTNSGGQILSAHFTGLRPVNQRKIAKMIRRIQGMGLYPTIHDQPEMLRGSFFPQ